MVPPRPAEEYDVGARLLESELAKLSKQLATQERRLQAIP